VPREGEVPWRQDEADRLLALWMEATAEGTWRWTVTAIGHALGRSRNSVIGRLKRMDAPPRQNPVTKKAIVPQALEPGAEPPPPPPPPVAVIRLPRPRYMAVQTALRPSEPCQWLDGDERPYAQCCAPRMLGRSYCADHHRVAYRGAPEVVV
jgi:hypothetical protein